MNSVSYRRYKVLIIDNYDSFIYNIYQLIGELTSKAPIVVRNDHCSLNDVIALRPTHIVISPGPGNPENQSSFGIAKEVIQELGKAIPILGVCLGHQGIAHCFGARIVASSFAVHGKTSLVFHNDQGIYHGIPNPFYAMRYHSLMVDRLTLPATLHITSQTSDGIIMGVAHERLPIVGVQFHPESIGTPYGKMLLGNFLSGIL